MNKSILFFVALLMLLAGGMALRMAISQVGESGATMEEAWSVEDEDYPAESETWIEDFELTERSGQPFVSKDEMPGTVWVSSVFFASCPTSCRRQNAVLKEVADACKGQNVRFMSITCDPRNDTPKRLREYARGFDADPKQWVFLTGNMYYIPRIAGEKFQLIGMYDPEEGPTHSDAFAVTDKWGNLRDGNGKATTFAWANPVKLAEMQVLIDELIAETEPPKNLQKPTLTITPVEEESDDDDAATGPSTDDEGDGADTSTSTDK